MREQRFSHTGDKGHGENKMTTQKNITLHYIHTPNNKKKTIILDYKQVKDETEKELFKQLCQLAIATEHNPPFIYEDKYINAYSKPEKLINTFTFEIEKQNKQENWIEEHGSDELKLALELGLHITGAYWKERIAIEYPGWKKTYSAFSDKLSVNPSKLFIQVYSFMAKEQELDPRQLYLRFDDQLGETLYYYPRGEYGNTCLYMPMKDVKEAIVDNFRFLTTQGVTPNYVNAVQLAYVSENNPFVKSKFQQIYTSVKSYDHEFDKTLRSTFSGLFSDKVFFASRSSADVGEGYFSDYFITLIDKELSQQLKTL